MLSDPKPVVICYYFHYFPGNWVWLHFLCAVQIWGDLPSCFMASCLVWGWDKFFWTDSIFEQIYLPIGDGWNFITYRVLAINLRKKVNFNVICFCFKQLIEIFFVLFSAKGSALPHTITRNWIIENNFIFSDKPLSFNHSTWCSVTRSLVLEKLIKVYGLIITPAASHGRKGCQWRL